MFRILFAIGFCLLANGKWFSAVQKNYEMKIIKYISTFSSLVPLAQCILVIKQQAEKSLNAVLKPAAISKFSRVKEVWEPLLSVFLEPWTKYICTLYF
jgi:hypothetical protein